MPFITEELWQNMSDYLRHNNSSVSILSSPWPESDETKIDDAAVKEMRAVQEFVTAVRTIRSEMNVPPGKNVSVAVRVTSEEQKAFLTRNEVYIKALGKIESLEAGTGVKKPKQSAVSLAAGFEIFVPLGGIIDLEIELKRLQKEILAARGEIERCGQKLANSDFVKRAPEKEVAKIKERLEEAKLKISRLNDSIESLKQ